MNDHSNAKGISASYRVTLASEPIPGNGASKVFAIRYAKRAANWSSAPNRSRDGRKAIPAIARHDKPAGARPGTGPAIHQRFAI